MDRSRPSSVTTAVLEATVELLTTPKAEPSMRAIARRAGVGVASIYDHFDGRQGLMDAVLTHVTEHNFRKLSAPLTLDAPLETVLEHLVDDTFKVYTSTPLLTHTALVTLIRMDRARFVQAERDRFSQLVADRIAMDIPLDRGTLDRRVRTVIDMIMGAVVASLHRDAVPDTSSTRAIVHSIVRAELSTLRLLARTP